MFEMLQSVGTTLAHIWAFVANVFAGIKTAFAVILSLQAAVTAQVQAMPAWISILLLTAIVVAIALVVMLSR